MPLTPSKKFLPNPTIPQVAQGTKSITPGTSVPTPIPTPGSGDTPVALSDAIPKSVVTFAVGGSAGTDTQASRSDHTHVLPNLTGDVGSAFNANAFSSTGIVKIDTEAIVFATALGGL